MLLSNRKPTKKQIERFLQLLFVMPAQAGIHRLTAVSWFPPARA
jgi:hypothetical protein